MHAAVFCSRPRQSGSAPANDNAGGQARVCLGVVVGAHGVRGTLRIKPFTEDPEAVAHYGPVSDESGRNRYTLEIQGLHKGVVLARVAGIADRDAALALKGTRLYVPRAALPEVEDADTFYHADLIGLPVEDPAGQPLGRVRAVQDYGAGDVLELITPDGGERLLPFTRAAVPVVALEAGRIVADPPAEIGDPEPAGDNDDDGQD